MPDNMADGDWTDRRVDLIVVDYFNMLRLKLIGVPAVKAQPNVESQELVGHSQSSIEFQHQNIRAVLLHLGMPWILDEGGAGYDICSFDLSGRERLMEVKDDGRVKLDAVFSCPRTSAKERPDAFRLACLYNFAR